MGRSNTAPRCLKQEKAGRTDNLLAPLSLPGRARQAEGQKEGQKVSGDFTSPSVAPSLPPWPTKGIRAVTFADDAAVLGCCGGVGGDETRVQLRSHSPYAYAARAYFVLSSLRKRVIHAHLQRQP